MKGLKPFFFVTDIGFIVYWLGLQPIFDGLSAVLPALFYRAGAVFGVSEQEGPCGKAPVQPMGFFFRAAAGRRGRRVKRSGRGNTLRYSLF